MASYRSSSTRHEHTIFGLSNTYNYFFKAVPHRAIRDSVQKGYAIPEGTLVIANVWKFLHDPEVYKNPMDFNPDR